MFCRVRFESIIFAQVCLSQYLRIKIVVICSFYRKMFLKLASTSLGEERANLSAFRTFGRFVLVWICRFPLPLGIWEELRFVIVALPGLFSYLFLKQFVSCMFLVWILWTNRGTLFYSQLIFPKQFNYHC